MNFLNIERLLSITAVSSERTSLSETEVMSAWQARLLARNELMVYLATYLGDEPVQCYVTFPFDDIEVTVTNEDIQFDSEFIYLPFGWFSLNLWDALRKDKNNLLFKVLRYLSWNVDLIVRSLDSATATEEPITGELLSEQGIMDIFSLHSYIGVYENIDKWIGADRSR